MNGRQWRGQTSPRSATGRSSLVEPLPHHISAEGLHVGFRADPARVAQFLPPGLESVDGRGWAMVAEMAKVSAAEPEQFWRQPARSNYNEGLVGFYCRYGDKVGRYTAFVWVDRDWSIGMGQIFGWSKRLATIHRTRLQDVNPGLPALGPGASLGATVERNGATVMQLAVRVPADARPEPSLPAFGSTTFLYRYIPSPSPDVEDVEQLFELGFDNVKTAPVWRGEGRLAFGAAADEELPELGPLEIEGGWFFRRGWTTDAKARLLHDYTDARRRQPHAAE